MALLEPGDKVMGMRLDQGGHLTHGSPVNFSGRMYDFVAYGVDDDDGDARLRRDPRPRGARAAAHDHRRRDRVLAHHRLRGVPLDRRRGRRAAARRRRAHRRARSPAARTRRRFRTPTSSRSRRTRRCAARAAARSSAAREHAAAIDKAVFPGSAGRPADARDRGEGGRVPRGEPAVRSASTRPTSSPTRARSPTRSRAEGFRIVSGGTDNHLMLVDLRPFGVTGKVAQEALDRAGITVQQERDPERPREAVRHERAAARHRVGHDRGHGRRRDARDRGADRAGARAPSTTTASRPRYASRPTASAPSSRRTPRADASDAEPAP